MNTKSFVMEKWVGGDDDLLDVLVFVDEEQFLVCDNDRGDQDCFKIQKQEALELLSYLAVRERAELLSAGLFRRTFLKEELDDISNLIDIKS